jgi:hypothetical protein
VSGFIVFIPRDRLSVSSDDVDPKLFHGAQRPHSLARFISVIWYTQIIALESHRVRIMTTTFLTFHECEESKAEATLT